MNSPDPDQYPDLSNLRQRSELLRMIRRFFDKRDFLEVQPPCLMSECIADPFIEPISISTDQIGLGTRIQSPRLFLQTSPELAMKRMLARGSGSIYSTVPVFRAGESGSHHNIEFTMLEWYEVGASMAGGVNTLGDLAMQVFDSKSFDVLNYRDAFRNHLAIDPIEYPIAQIQALVEKVDVALVAKIADDRDAMLDVLLSERIQPHLGKDHPVILQNYPLTQAALAKPSEQDPQCAARFELFCRGIEIANGYDELLDDAVFIERCESVNRKRIADGRDPVEVPTKLVQAMRDGFPPSAGVAMGIDRVMMVRSAIQSGVAPEISEVMPFTIDRV